jgi:hypothetical protein
MGLTQWVYARGTAQLTEMCRTARRSDNKQDCAGFVGQNIAPIHEGVSLLHAYREPSPTLRLKDAPNTPKSIPIEKNPRRKRLLDRDWVYWGWIPRSRVGLAATKRQRQFANNCEVSSVEDSGWVARVVRKELSLGRSLLIERRNNIARLVPDDFGAEEFFVNTLQKLRFSLFLHSEDRMIKSRRGFVSALIWLI